ncbi:MAG: Holliday junction resolvase RuvX [Candidatus Absconditabacteria bacterium]|nr:Holliday junction resolvase RuvX [Candidatus Absconditabacteria bacterium]MDD3868235.1 Holliday junction resolvase RuvX [Candidatus Absconditabacteria bacterium]MDD4714637.1 Holliday junction resolvase RuvX [Candidatus Absconditabacteria bacterium]
MGRIPPTALGIDRGSKYIGLAYSPNSSEIIFPVGYLMNDQMVYFHIADIIKRHNVKTIVLGWPSKQKDIQEKITKFMQSLNYIIEKDEITIETMEEDYTSVESGEIISNFKKNEATDTVSAMLILERWKKSENK